MSNHPDLVIEALNTGHNRAQFVSGNYALDHYLHKQAGQDMKRGISRVFVATRLESPATIVGFYTLSSLSIAFEDLPESIAKKLPRIPIPVALLGRVAVSLQEQKNGIGKLLIASAIRRTLNVSRDLAIYAIVVDPVDDAVTKFYSRLGFAALSNTSLRMYLPLRQL